MDPEHDALWRAIRAVRRDLVATRELLDTIATPPWKRLLFFLQGYRLWRLGRWYGKTKDLR